ncbi:MAG: LemA family protein [Candidatus Kerfeldbacteria bacterium]
MTGLWITLGIILFVILIIAGIYNRLISLRNRTDESWSDIDVQLKRRHDLIPNLVETVKGYATHERQAFENVTKARAAALGAQSMADKAKAENMLTESLKSIFAIAEAYPDLKASTNFAKLQDELSDTENKIQAARRFYNGNVRDFNTALQTFPTNVLANMFSFKVKEFFQVEGEDEKQPVKVQF